MNEWMNEWGSKKSSPLFLINLYHKGTFHVDVLYLKFVVLGDFRPNTYDTACTVEQEMFATLKFREFAIFANFCTWILIF